mgnify:CR=1 FL=1
MIEQVNFDDDYEGLRVQLTDVVELRACEKEFRGERRIDLRIWRLQKNKLNNQYYFQPTRQGIFIEVSRMRDVMTYLQKLLKD